MGRAQEKTTVFRTQKRRNPETGGQLSVAGAGHGHGDFYVYAVDDDFVPSSLRRRLDALESEMNRLAARSRRGGVSVGALNRREHDPP